MGMTEFLGEDKRYPQARGLDAVISHLHQLGPGARRYIHMSDIPKVGLKPKNQTGTGTLEPVGIYTYRSDLWLNGEELGRWGTDALYVHVIKVKPGTRIAGSVQTREALDKLKAEMPEKFPGHIQDPSGLANKYLRKLGYGVVVRKVQGHWEYIILGRDFIDNITTFQIMHLPKGATSGVDNVEGWTEFTYTDKALGIDPYKDLLLADPTLAWRLGFMVSQGPPGQPLHWSFVSNPRKLAKTKLLLRALKTKTKLTPAQQQQLIVPHDTDQYPNRLLDIYREYFRS